MKWSPLTRVRRRDKLVRGEVRVPSREDDDRVVEAAADRGVQVVMSYFGNYLFD